MDWDGFLSGLGWVLLIEGVLPLVAPARWRRMFQDILKHHDGQIRFFGLLSMVLGLILLILQAR